MATSPTLEPSRRTDRTGERLLGWSGPAAPGTARPMAPVQVVSRQPRTWRSDRLDWAWNRPPPDRNDAAVALVNGFDFKLAG